MDFKRIILLLTLFFLIFDGYLAYRVYQQIDITTVRQRDYQQKDIEQRLTERGISILQPLNVERGEGYMMKTEDNQYLQDKLPTLLNQTATYNEGVLTSTFHTALSLEGLITANMNSISGDIARYIRDTYLVNSELFIEGDKYTQFWYLPSTRTVIFWMTATNQLPIVDGTSEIRLQLDENYNIVSYMQTYQENFVPLDEQKPYPLISMKEAVEVLDRRVQTNLPSNATIIHVTLSYIKNREWDTINVYLPVWNVVYQRAEGQTGSMLVDAIKGEVVER